MSKEDYQIVEVIFKKCPVCKSGKVAHIKPKGFLGGLLKREKISCDKCSAQFIEEENKEEERVFRLDLSKSDKEHKNTGEALKVSEWQRGMSDLDYCVKQNILPKLTAKELNIIIKPNEQPHWCSGAELMEERAVRRSYGGAVRVMKGVYVGTSHGESHGELRKIDRGGLLLTNQRLVFNGSLRNTEYKLAQIISVEEYKDAIEIAASNRQRVQIFVVDEPHKWATYLKMAIAKSHKGTKERKPEWLEQEEKNREFFRSEKGVSPINVLREKAKEYERSKDYKKAEELYHKIAKMSKMEYDYCALGDVLQKLGKNKEAITAYKDALRLEPDSTYAANAIKRLSKEK